MVRVPVQTTLRRLVALALLVGAAACAPMQTTDAPARPAQIGPVVDPNGPVVVAVMTPRGAPNPDHVALGTALVNAAQMAAAEIGDPRLDLRFYDTAADPSTAATAATRAMDDGAALILGPLFAATAVEVGRVATPRGVTVLSYSTDTTITGGTLHATGFTPEMEARRILDHAARTGARAIGVFYPQTPYGDAALRGASEAAAALGLQIAATGSYARSFEGIQAGAGDFARIARDAGVQAVLLPDGGQGLRSVGAFLDFHKLGPGEVRFLGLGQWNSPITLQERALRGGVFAAPAPGRFEAFAARYAAQYGAEPPFVAVLAYDGVAMAAEMLAAARAAGSTAPFVPPALTRPEGFQGVLGPVRIAADGRVERGLAVLGVGEDIFVPVEPSPPAFAAGS